MAEMQIWVDFGERKLQIKNSESEALMDVSDSGAEASQFVVLPLERAK